MSFSASIKELLGGDKEEGVRFFYDNYNYKRLKV
jgi:hypothetical protein